MASNAFGILFRITTWGESHGKAIGVVIDGCPAGLALEEADIQTALDRRKPGGSAYVSPRKEPDRCEILSGVYQGQTTGTPISIMIRNQDAHAEDYTPVEHVLRPGHAHFTYVEKYGVFDYRGGGRASARETACRVAAGAVASKLLQHYDITITGFLQQVGNIEMPIDSENISQTPLFCPHLEMENKVKVLLDQLIEEGDSVGGVVGFQTSPLPIGLGDPVYGKLEAKLAEAMLSLPASKGFEIGRGFAAAMMHGSDHNDPFHANEDKISLKKNDSGGILGGISNGESLYGRVAFKPASSIRKAQATVSTTGRPTLLEMPSTGRHDPCVAIRAVPVVEAMVALVIADVLLLNRTVKL